MLARNKMQDLLKKSNTQVNLNQAFGRRLTMIFKNKKKEKEKESSKINFLNQFVFMKEFTQQTKLNLMEKCEQLDRHNGWEMSV